MEESTLARLTAACSVDTDDPVDGCWIWTNHLNDGYGQLRVDGPQRYAHVVMFEMAIGPVPDGLTLDHLCRNRACVNPRHLEPVTNRENVLRGEVPTANRGRCKNDRHDLADAGVYVDSDGTERCRACRLESKRAYRERRAA